MLRLRRGRVTEVAENGLLLAAVEEIAYTERSIPLEAGDRFLLYTDGLVEARNSAGIMFGDDSLASALEQSAGLAPADAADRIIASVQKWASFQDDDLTVLVCDYPEAA
jgi:sigma-B regulation protein RsbU (phosphoserine phosphatase)